MTTRQPFSVLVATDGSRPARDAVEAATRFPWPRGARAHGLIARRGLAPEGPAALEVAVGREVARIAAETREALAVRWPDAEVTIVGRAPVDAILHRARTLGAGAIVVGSRGHGLVGRLLLGSVSRGVLRRAVCPVLVVRGRAAALAHLVVGIDGSAHARHAVDFVAGLEPPRDGQVTVVRVVELVRPPSMGLMPAKVRATLAEQVRIANAQRVAPATREMEAAVATLRQAGWRARGIVRSGPPLEELLRAVRTTRAHVLVLGARGVGGVERLLLGSVAEGALTRSPVSVLIVR